jgi:hypothetical protein
MRRALLLVAALLAVAALAACGSDGDETAPETEETVRAAISIEGGQPAGGEQEIKVKSGQHVVVEITSDTPDEVHLHGYDLETAVEPGKPAELDFDASLEGIFELESHTTETVLAKLVVEP